MMIRMMTIAVVFKPFGRTDYGSGGGVLVLPIDIGGQDCGG